MRPFYEWLLRQPDLARRRRPARRRRRRARRLQPPRPRARALPGLHLRRAPARALRQHGDVQPHRRLPLRGVRRGRSRPLCACLNAGWRTGLSGVTDEHGTDWGYPEGKGRTGLWVTGTPAQGCARRCGPGGSSPPAPRGCGSTPRSRSAGPSAAWAGHSRSPAGPGPSGSTSRGTDSWLGKPLHVQVLRPGPEVPEVVDVVPFRVGAAVSFRTRLRRRGRRLGGAAGQRPAAEQRHARPRGHPCNDLGVAYTSPWWLEG